MIVLNVYHYSEINNNISDKEYMKNKNFNLSDYTIEENNKIIKP